MALVDPALLQKLKVGTVNAAPTTANYVRKEAPEVTLLPSAGTEGRTNPFLRNVNEKRLIGLRSFLNRIIKDKPSPKYSYRRLKKYNEALASLIRLRNRSPNFPTPPSEVKAQQQKVPETEKVRETEASKVKKKQTENIIVVVECENNCAYIIMAVERVKKPHTPMRNYLSKLK